MSLLKRHVRLRQSIVEIVAQMLRGHSLQDGIEEIVQDIMDHYQGKAQNAIVSAVKDLHRQYVSYLNDEQPRGEYEETTP